MHTRLRSSASDAADAATLPRGHVRRGLTVLALAAIALLASGCGAAGADVSATGGQAVASSHIDVADDVFEPDAVEVVAGTEVTWTWVGKHPHNVHADGFASDTQTSGTFTHAFEQPGTYSYVCTLHGGMAGTVIVTAEADGGAT